MPLELDAAYTCPVCFEENWIAVDAAGGRKQQLVEDCPVCCHPIVFVLHIDRDGDVAVVSATAEGR
jgi:hypothetical protein